MLAEPGDDQARALLQGREALLVPDVWLGEATSVLWLRARRGELTPEEAAAALALLAELVPPTPTDGLGLHAVALEIALAVGHSPYDTLYLAFAAAMRARAVVVLDRAFVASLRRHPDPALARMVIPLSDWSAAEGPG